LAAARGKERLNMELIILCGRATREPGPRVSCTEDGGYVLRVRTLAEASGGETFRCSPLTQCVFDTVVRDTGLRGCSAADGLFNAGPAGNVSPGSFLGPVQGFENPLHQSLHAVRQSEWALFFREKRKISPAWAGCVDGIGRMRAGQLCRRAVGLAEFGGAAACVKGVPAPAGGAP
jgi:hypothetical protein